MKAALLAGVLLLAVPTPASADVIFDPADADELAAVLAEAYTDQGVCYGWSVTVDNVGIRDDSIGSNFGAGKPVDSGSCRASVEFTATITYTSESSESEDSASYDVRSTPAGVTSADLNALDIDFGGLTGEDPDAVVGKAVTALPLLAADKGLAQPLSASPDTATAPADAQLTDDPGSDWWRDRGGMLIWALILMAASGVLIWAILRMNRRARLPALVEVTLSPYGPEPLAEVEDPAAPSLEGEPVPEEQAATQEAAAEPDAAEPPVDQPSAEPTTTESTTESTVDETDDGSDGTDQARPAPPDQKDKE